MYESLDILDRLRILSRIGSPPLGVFDRGHVAVMMRRHISPGLTAHDVRQVERLWRAYIEQSATSERGA